jgi:hypothetical protein
MTEQPIDETQEDATAEDNLVEQTENAPLEEDGPQDDVDQLPVYEEDVDG